MHITARHRNYLLVSLAVTALASAVIVHRVWYARARNVILISLDDLRRDRLGCYGYRRETSPGLDRLSARSVVFDDAVTQFTSTRYSHRAILTGRYPFRATPTKALAEILRENGFRTAGFTGGGFMDQRFGFGPGFEQYVNRADAYTGLQESLPKAIAWLEEHRHEPFFLFLHTYDVHCPFAPPEPYRSMFLGGAPLQLEVDGKCDNNYFNKLKLTPSDIEQLNAVYDADVRWTDSLLEDLWKALDRLDLYDDTMIVVLSDHGERLGEYGGVGHGQLREEEVRTPLIMHIPRVGPRRNREPVQLVDVVPTILGELGIEVTGGLDGIDLGPVITGRRVLHDRIRFTQSVRGNVALRWGARWKLIVPKEEGPVRLFDLVADDTKDVAAAHSMVVTTLRQALDELKGGADLVDEPVVVDNDLAAQLRALGYVE